MSVFVHVLGGSFVFILIHVDILPAQDFIDGEGNILSGSLKSSSYKLTFNCF